ncbi:HAD family hydrolase [Promicromonospora thailandica]|uniref:2-haloacid dehalogenase n=1 Tax=Promicromonospora thailandica TaxID=765201 RepID=A0A9X2G1P7_9MICO|nr:HAD family phosphatase [Promicromonospora thailandica]MCP2265435.1 2-haloacid dehalogenase [Promicromonospora thailandica]BFF16979.1 HAD family phosphatase [Promicromonospora thailandica]
MSTTPAPDARIDTRIDTVVYDFGNVLIGWDPFGPYAGRPRAEVEAFFDAVDFGSINHAADAGTSYAVLLERVGRTHPDLVDDLRHYVDHYEQSLTGPVAGSAELVAELKGLGLRLYGLTNWQAETFHSAEPAAPAIGLMDDVIVSGREGMAKPDRRMFELVAERFGVDPARAVFVDDKPVNVDAARGVGFHGIVFTHTAALRQELRALGVPVAA